MEVGKFVYAMNSSGLCVIGKLANVEENANGDKEYYVDAAMICDTVRTPGQQPGIFHFSYMMAPVNCLEPKTVDVMIRDVNFMFSVEENSPLATLYSKTMKSWEAQRSNIIQAQPGDEDKVARMFDIPRN